MIELIPKIFAYNFTRIFHFPKLLPINYTISLLYTCNSRCKTCNIYKKKAKNLNLEEYKKIFKSIGKSPYWITLSGGEPFLRNDIADICYALYTECKPKIINIPTNGILTNKITEQVHKIANMCPKTQIIINLSIDGIEDEHDEIRQIPGNYKKVIDTYAHLRKLELKNLSIGIHTVISRFNVERFAAIATKLMTFAPDSYITEIAEQREELGTMQEEITPDAISYKSAIDFLIHRIKHEKFSGMNKITQAFRIEYYNLVKKILRDKKQIIPCFSGIASTQISPDGDVWSCCIKAKNMGNVRDTDYNFRKIWKSKSFTKERRSIYRKECYCPLANAAYTNMLLNFPILCKISLRLLKIIK